MNFNRSEGIILQALRLKEADQLLTIFTPLGVIKVIFHGALSKKHGYGTLSAPLQQIEILYKKKAQHSELHTTCEISLLNPFRGLRQKLEYLESAGEMGAALLSSQQPENQSDTLYRLFLLFLENIPSAKDPYLLATSFKLKMLRHEGVLSLQPQCSFCSTEITEISLQGGESFCQKHAPVCSFFFDLLESHLLLECAYGKSISQMKVLTAPLGFHKKVHSIFQSLLRSAPHTSF